MKCPYRKVTYHQPSDDYMKPAYGEEGFAECYGKECPYYDNGYCSRVLKEEQMNNDLIDNAPIVETSKIEYKAYNEGFKDGVDQGIKLSERPHGKWLLCEDSNFSKCSICGVIWLNEECNNYCPNCGADMRKGGNKNE